MSIGKVNNIHHYIASKLKFESIGELSKVKLVKASNVEIEYRHLTEDSIEVLDLHGKERRYINANRSNREAVKNYIDHLVALAVRLQKKVIYLGKTAIRVEDGSLDVVCTAA